jgi:tetratricopeptide (TPR) repeat protein
VTRSHGRRALLGLGLLVVALTSGGIARADRIDDAWRRGNEAYFKGDYAAAVTAFEQLDRQGVVSADLYYNLGVAHFRQGSLGRAIWSFERAAALDPEAEDARFNLAQARKLAARRARDKIEGAERDPLWIRVVTATTASFQTWTFLLLYFGAFALLFWRRRAPEDSRGTLGAGAAILGVAAALAGLLVAGRLVLDRIPFAIVLPDAVAVKEGADPNYRTSFELHAGLRVRLLEQDQDWVRIRLENGLEGWVRAQDVGRL